MCARGGGANLNQGRKLPTKRNRSPSPSVDAVLGGMHQHQQQSITLVGHE
jgi:hypothetical protein